MPDYNDKRHLGFKMTQRPEVFMIFNYLFNNEIFEKIIEIGTHKAGTSLFLAYCAFAKNMEFHTFDIELKESVARNLVKELNGILHVADTFSIDGINTIKQLIQSPGRVLLLCDGGNKIKEFNIFSKYLKSRDVIMAHDYFPTKKDLKKSFWKSCEITDKAVRNSCIKYNLKPFYQENFKDIVWLSRIRGKENEF